MDRSERRRKYRRTKLWVGAASLVSLGIFSGLAAAGTRPQQRRALEPAQQLGRLEASLGYPFWDTSAHAPSPIVYVTNVPHTSSGGS